MRESKLKLFGITPKTRKQKQFMKVFIIFKSVISIIIFVLVIFFLWKLRMLGD